VDEEVENDMEGLPECGLYRTTVASIDGILADRLVYFHNHGSPGPGVYYPDDWVDNRAVFSGKGYQIPSPDFARTLRPLPAEGFYYVANPFFCCAKECREFRAGELVQLGYNRFGQPILFMPGYRASRFELPKKGVTVDAHTLDKLVQLTVQSYGESKA